VLALKVYKFISKKRFISKREEGLINQVIKGVRIDLRGYLNYNFL
jgi:hypothetical protein